MFKDKMGFNQHLLIDDPDTRQGCLNWVERVKAGFGTKTPTVDYQIIHGQLFLCEKTADYIYSEFTALVSNYVPGSRPFLEDILSEITGPEMSDREKALAIMRRCRDNWDGTLPTAPGRKKGGSEEDIIRRGSITCHEISRVFVVLCQIAGIPARIACAHIYGHMMAEACFDGKWAWFDPRHGLYFHNDDGTFASYWEMIQDPSLVDRQDRSVWDDFSAVSSYKRREVAEAFHEEFCAHYQMVVRDCLLHPKEAFAIGNYYVWDHDKYDYPEQTTEGSSNLVAKERVQRLEARMRLKFGYPIGYWNHMLHDEPLRLRGAE